MLYHYTTLDAFALILQSKKIRFSRLTNVDDPNEYGYIKEGINPAHYVYISCWTYTPDENIPQWKMYANNGHGVRLGLSSNMFNVSTYNGKYLNVFPNDYFDDKDYYILPVLSLDEFLSDIKYVDYPLNEIDYNIFTTLNGKSAIDFKELGKYKSADWQFQKERRYRIYIVPKNNGKIPSNFLGESIIPPITYIDIPIIEDAFNNMEITLGPYITESEKIIANALMNQYIKTPKIKNSVFSNY